MSAPVILPFPPFPSRINPNSTWEETLAQWWADFTAALESVNDYFQWVAANVVTLPCECVLAINGGNLVLSRRNGYRAILNNAVQEIPVAGVSLAPAGLEAGDYYIYLAMSGGAMGLEASATGYVQDPRNGVCVRSDDASRTLVGMARVDAASAWTYHSERPDSVSWYNVPAAIGAAPAIHAAQHAPGGPDPLALVPTGWVGYFAATTPPAGFLECNGAAISRTTYGGLFAVIGTTFGVGDGVTTYNIPELRAEFIRGWDRTRGVDAGRAFGSSQEDAFEQHVHASNTFCYNTPGSQAVNNLYYGTGASQGTFNTGGATSGSGTETRPRNVALLPCIKY
jgi:microcystin-dependent protein